MTAFAALWRLDGAPARDGVCRMQAALAPYGRAPPSVWEAGAVALSRQLLPHLPEDAQDRGVIVGGGGRFVLAADVRIDNRAALIRDLGLDRRAEQLADADLLLAGWERWGPRVAGRLTGVFAFVLWDARDRALYLARDPSGARPLFYACGPDFIAVASMPGGLFPLLGGVPEADTRRIVEFLTLSWGQGPDSWFQGISRVERGHLLRLDGDGRARDDAFWRPQDIVPFRPSDPREYAEGMRAHLERAVAAQIRSSTPVASQLSAGLDSSAVTAAAARLLATRGEDLDAFTHVPDPRYGVMARPGRFGDEGPLAALTAARYPTIRHHRQPMPDVPLLSLHPRLHAAFQAPTGNTVNGLWLDQMFRTAQAAGIGVMLQGAAGNFTLSYGGLEAPADLLRRGAWGAGLRHLWALHRGTGQSLPALASRMFAGRRSTPLFDALRRWSGRPLPDPTLLWALRPEGRARADVQALLADIEDERPADPPVDGRAHRIALLQRGDQGCYLKGFQMLYGIDLRDPTRDLDLVNFSLSIPPEVFSRGGRPKDLYRAAFGDWLPPEVVTARRRGAQGANWFALMRRDRADLRAALTCGGQPRPDLIDYAALTQDLAALDRADEGSEAVLSALYHRLLRTLTLIRFLRQVPHLPREGDAA